MPHIKTIDAQAWTEPTKLPVTNLDINLEASVALQVLSQLKVNATFDTAAWTDEDTTPSLIRSIIAMHYVAWLYDKHYAQEEEGAAYAETLRRTANANIALLLSGDIILDEYELPEDTHVPTFFPNDASSANVPSVDFPSDGGPSFMMGSVF